MMEFNSIEEAIGEIKKGNMVVVVDDPQRENEGDLICAAQLATEKTINFMATYGKGLICMPMSQGVTEKLKLSQMVQNNSDNHGTAFTVSIDSVHCTTGISANERALTANRVAQHQAKPEYFRRPGHMFPLESKKDGVLERNGHTEATVDLVRLAGLYPVGICCEILREDGNMMRTKELTAFAKKHQLIIITIKDLVSYRLETGL